MSNPELDYATEERIKGAAPDMLHALRCAELAISKLLEIKRNTMSSDLREEFEKHLQLVRDALAKAEGKAES